MIAGPTRRGVTAVGVLVAAATLAAGCAATSRPSGDSSPPSSVASTPSSPDVTGTPPIASSASAPVSSSSGPATSGSASSSAPSGGSSTPVPPRSTCDQLTVRVLIGSAAPGYEFAALQFVNAGTSACTLVGVPAVTLLRGGSQVGTPSVANSGSAAFAEYRLAPGATAESRLKDFSGCSAPLSDTVRVVAPGSNITTTRPGELRACKLVVYPLGAPE